MAVGIVVGTVFFIMNFHIVLYDGGGTVLKKEEATFDGTFVNLGDVNPATYMALPAPVRKFMNQRGLDKAKKIITDSLDKIK